jgi:class 3 adenylate cyclase
VAREQRKLVAIVAADIVGHSGLMGRDESGTLARLCSMEMQHQQPQWDRLATRKRETRPLWSD